MSIFPDLPLEPSPPNRPANAASLFMSNVQGGILAGRGRGRNVALMFFRFSNPESHEANCAIIRETSTEVTSALAQYYRAGGADWEKMSDIFLSFMLTSTGLAAAGMKTARGMFPSTVPEKHLPLMNSPGEFLMLGDSMKPPGQPETWQTTYRRRIDGVWLIGHATAGGLAKAIRERRAWCERRGLKVVKLERGHVPADGKEAFGFRDGISMQRFFKRVPGALDTKLEEVFLPGSADHHGSSFMVYRKLEQNVRAFRAYEKKQTAEEVAALVGRQKSGAPLAPDVPPTRNGFDYGNDPVGAQCPFHAHIRRANPRAVHNSGGFRKRFHLVRRGAVYGAKSRLAAPEGVASGVGLLFIAYTSEIATFREMQGVWMVSEDFPVPAPQQTEKRDGLLFGPPGKDPGDTDTPAWVVPRGGAYLMVPSLAWLRTARPELSAPKEV
jgi:Dyp-type peroxidase family